MKKTLIIFLLIIASNGYSQVAVNNFINHEQQYLKTLLQTASYLKSKPTNTLSFHEFENYSKEEAFYDTVITKFFAKEKMLRLLEEDTSHFAVAGKLDIARHELNFLDYYLDIAPGDSVLIEPTRYLFKESSFKNEKHHSLFINSLNVFFKTGNKKILLLILHFDEESNKILSMSLNSNSKEESEEIVLFLKRQKKYYEFPDPKREFTINQ